jgi:membrane-associated phospholipid phosphatase
MANIKSGSIENIAQQRLGAERRRREAPETLPRSVRERAFTIVAVALTCVFLVSFSVALIDRPVATWVHEHLGSERFDWFTTTYFGPPLKFGPFSLMATPAMAVGPIAAFVFAILAIAGLAGWRPGIRSRTVLALCVSAFAANEINAFVKGLFGRTWPESWLGNNPSWIRDGVFGFFPFHGGQDWASFPSGHTTVITAIAAILWVVLPKLKVAWAALVAVVGVGLIAGNYHFVSDVIAGLYFGAGIGFGAAKLMLSPNDRTESSGPPNRLVARRIDRGADPPTSVEVGSRTARALAYAILQRYHLRKIQRHRSTTP